MAVTELAFAVLGMAAAVVTVLVLTIVTVAEWRYSRQAKRPVVERDVMTVYPGGRTAAITKLPDHRSRP